MNLYRDYIGGIFIAVVITFAANAQTQIPVKPNKIVNGKRQGAWVVTFDELFKPTSHKDSIAYYRLVQYKDDKPVGVVQDFYKNGKLQFKGLMKQDRPTEVLEGPVTWYNDKEQKEADAIFVNGKATKLTSYFTNGTVIGDSVQALMQNGLSLFQKGNVMEAIVEFEKARIRTKIEAGLISAVYVQIVYYLGTIYYNVQQYQQSERCFHEQELIYRTALGVRHPKYGLAASDLGMVYKALGDYPRALQYYTTAREIFAENKSKMADDYVSASIELGKLYGLMDEHQKCEEMYKEVIAYETQAKLDSSASVASAMNGLGMLYNALGRYDEAETMMRRAAYLHNRVSKNKADYASILNNYAGVKRSVNKLNEAVRILEQVLAIKQSTIGKEHASYAITLNNLGEMYLDLGEFAKAETFMLEALAIIEKVLGRNHPHYASALGNLADVYASSALYDRALKLSLESRALIEKISGTESIDYATRLNNLAKIYYETGDYAKAEPLFLETLRLYEKYFGKGHSSYGLLVNNLASLYTELGNYKKAEKLYFESLENAEKNEGRRSDPYADALNNLAQYYTATSDTAKTIRLLTESNAIYKEIYGPDHLTYATSLANLGSIYRDVKKFDQARKYLEEATAIRLKKLGDQHTDYALSLVALGGLYKMQHNLPEAQRHFARAAEIYRKKYDNLNVSLTNVLSHLADTHKEMGEMAKAEPLYLEVLAGTRHQILHQFPSFSEKEKELFYLQRQVYIRQFERFAIERYKENPAILNDWLDVRLATKGLLFNASNKMRDRIQHSNDKELIRQFGDWQSKKNFLMKAYQMSGEEKKSRGIEVTKLEEEVNGLEKQLSIRSEAFGSAIDSKLYSWKEVQARLKPGEAAIEMVRTTTKDKEDIVSVKYVAFVVTPRTKKNPDIIIFENGDELEKRYVKYYHNMIKLKSKDELSYNQFWKPLTDKLKSVTKVYFSPDGVFYQININTLLDPGSGKFVVNQSEVHLLSSLKDLVANSGKVEPEIRQAILFGFPDYNNETSAVSQDSARTVFASAPVTIKVDSAQRFFDGQTITMLPGTKIEVNAIEQLLSQKNVPVKSFLLKDATEDQVKQVASPQVLHLATHGYFLADVGGGRDERNFAGISSSAFESNPLLRSGLMFAGAKDVLKGAAISPDKEDGILTAYEAMNLALDKTAMVVMSACETGLGVTSNGEGVYGLQRAFQVAGAKSVLMSLWTVSDEATQLLMTSFYDNWLTLKNPRIAFRRAQQSLQEKYPEPYYWGAFVIVGE